MKRMYIRGVIDNAPVKLALWLDYAEVPGYDVPCAVLFVISIDKPDQPSQCEEFIFRFRHMFKDEPSQELIADIIDNFQNDKRN